VVAKVGFIGLGRMGGPMACNLQKKGFNVVGYDTNPQAASALTRVGGKGAVSVEETVRGSQFIFTMLPTSQDVYGMVAGHIVKHAAPGAVVVDMSTIDPLITDDAAALLAAAGIRFADAPVGRLASHADRGESLFMVGASEAVFADIEPLLQAMGTTIHHCGAVGLGIRMKVVNNYLAVASCQLNAETLTLAARFGLDLELTIEVLNGTTANNGHLKTNFPFKVLSGDTEPGFQIDLAHKDLGVALTAAAAMNVPLSMGSAARECLQIARSRGFGKKDFSGLLDAWCDIAGVTPPRLKRSP
jgi:4-hydroxybutyrate dehydrogenase/sulfolactaldehyde 3-reductase